MLAKRPGFSLTVIVVLVLGIGLNTAVFALFKSLALSPLAGVERSSGLRVVLNEMPSGRRDGLSYPDYQYLRDHDRAFNGLVGAVLTAVHVGRGSRTRQVMGELVTGNYFLELGVGAQLGRTLLPSDEVAPGGHPVVVLSDGLWRRAFAADPNIIGTTVHLNTVPMTVVGVANPAFHGTIVSFDIELFAPVMMAPQIGGGFLPQTTDLLSDRNIDFLMVLGRLRPGVTLGDANAQMEVFSEQLQREAGVGEIRRQVKVVPIWQSPYGAQTYMLPAVTVLGAMSALLLLIACANIAGLALVRAVSRRGEIGLRMAVGATRIRIVRLLLIENLVLAVPPRCWASWRSVTGSDPLRDSLAGRPRTPVPQCHRRSTCGRFLRAGGLHQRRGGWARAGAAGHAPRPDRGGERRHFTERSRKRPVAQRAGRVASGRLDAAPRRGRSRHEKPWCRPDG